MRYLSSVASAWLAFASTTGMSSSTYFVPSTYTDTTSRRWETAITSASVCLDTRSAVRWRVPVSCERIVGSGISWTFAIVIFVAFALRMIAPSIFATW